MKENWWYDEEENCGFLSIKGWGWVRKSLNMIDLIIRWYGDREYDVVRMGLFFFIRVFGLFIGKRKIIKRRSLNS